MNAIFILSLIVGSAVMLTSNADKLAIILQDGAMDALKLCATLTAIYAVWMGVFEILARTNLTDKLSKLLRKPLRWLFGDMGDGEDALVMNVTANVLGLSGVATPLGIEAMERFDRQKNTFAMSMLFVISATSLQLLPISVIALRAQMGSVSPASIILPSILSTGVSTAIGIILVKMFIKK